MDKRTFILVSPKNRTVYNFRGELIQKLVAQGFDVIVTGPEQNGADRIEALGARFVVIPMEKNGTSILHDLRYCLRLYRLFRQEAPDAVLGYTIKPVVYGSLAARLAGVRNINCLVTGGGYTFISKSLKARMLGCLVRFLYRLAFACANHVMFQNADDRDEFCRTGLVSATKSGVVNGSGVNLDKFTPKSLPENELSFFMLSRLLASKGVNEYLEAARIVKAAHPEVSFRLLGKYETEMQDAVPKEPVEACIRDGIISRYEETDDVRPYYADCSVYVLPSYREGTPRTVLEAMAMGRAIITTDANGCRETVRNGVNGFLVPVKDSAALADAMLRFVDDPSLAARMGQASLAYCREKFDVNRVNEAMFALMGLTESKTT